MGTAILLLLGFVLTPVVIKFTGDLLVYVGERAYKKHRDKHPDAATP